MHRWLCNGFQVEEVFTLLLQRDQHTVSELFGDQNWFQKSLAWPLNVVEHWSLNLMKILNSELEIMIQLMEKQNWELLELIMVELRENIESVKLIENLKVVMQQKVEMLKESLRKLTILIEQIVVRWREMIQTLYWWWSRKWRFWERSNARYFSCGVSKIYSWKSFSCSGI